MYATLLYESLHNRVSLENSNVLWHLLNGYMVDGLRRQRFSIDNVLVAVAVASIVC